ncbi:hypothetical protein ACTMU2_21595 [Cupriavidus basilensis]
MHAGNAGRTFGWFESSSKWGGVVAGLGAGAAVGLAGQRAPYLLGAALLDAGCRLPDPDRQTADEHTLIPPEIEVTRQCKCKPRWKLPPRVACRLELAAARRCRNAAELLLPRGRGARRPVARRPAGRARTTGPRRSPCNCSASKPGSWRCYCRMPMTDSCGRRRRCLADRQLPLPIAGVPQGREQTMGAARLGIAGRAAVARDGAAA